MIESLMSSIVCWRATGAYQQESLISAPKVTLGNNFGSLLILSRVWNVTSALWIPYISLTCPHSRTWADFFWGWWWMEYRAPTMKSPLYRAEVRWTTLDVDTSMIRIVIIIVVTATTLAVVIAFHCRRSRDGFPHWIWLSERKIISLNNFVRNEDFFVSIESYSIERSLVISFVWMCIYL